MKRFYTLFIALLFISFANAEEKTDTDFWRFQGFAGVVYNFPTPLVIKQNGYKDIKLTAEYETRPFETAPAPYFVWRIGKWDNDKAWELEHIHTKIYLKNKPPEVQRFQATFGYNIFTINRAWDKKDFIYRFGFGIVITHPSTIVRGQENDYVYYNFAGFGGQAAIEKIFFQKGRFFVSSELKLTAAYAIIPVKNGEAITPNVALHATLGIGFDY